MAEVTSPEASHASVTGVGAPVGRFILVAAWALIVLGAALNDNLPTTVWVAIPLAAGLIGGLLAAHPSGPRLGPIFASSAAICAIISSTVLFGMQPQGQMLWLYSYATYILGTIAMRGNLLATAIGSVGVLGVGAFWAAQHQASLSGYLLVLGVPVIILVACVTWNRTLIRVISRKTRYRSEAERAHLAEEAAKLDLARSSRELAAVRSEAGPLLARLSAGEPISDTFQLELQRAEARIRDRIRAPYLLHPALETAVLRVRLLGNEVVLIGETHSEGPDLAAPYDDPVFIGGSERERISGELAHAIADRLDAIGESVTVTIRSMPDSSEAALSLLIRSESGTRHTRFAHDGAVLTQR